MARIYTSGFEAGTAPIENLLGAASQVQSTVKRSGTYAWRLSSLSSGVAQLFGNWFAAANANGPYWFRVYVRFDTLPSAENRFCYFANSTPTQLIWLTVDNSGTVKLYDEDGQITGTTTVSADATTWYRFEVKVDVTAAAGSHVVEAKVGGSAFATSSTRSLSSGVRQWAIGGNLATEAQTTGDWYFDDIAINDSTGSVQTAYPGDGKIVHLFPNGDGDNAMGSRGGADSGSDWGQVDEAEPNDLTDYYILDIDNDIIDVALQSSADVGIGASDTITLAVPGSKSRSETNGQSITCNLRLKSQASGTVAAGTSQSHNDSTFKLYGMDAIPRVPPPLVSYVDPQAGGPWTPALLDTAQVGLEATDAAPNVWVTALWLLVEYVPAAAAGGQPWYAYQQQMSA